MQKSTRCSMNGERRIQTSRTPGSPARIITLTNRLDLTCPLKRLIKAILSSRTKRPARPPAAFLSNRTWLKLRAARRDLLQEATTKFPDRLDIWCGLAFIYQESGDFDNELATLKKMVAYTKAHPAGLKWLNGEPIEDPEDHYVPEKLHAYGQYYEQKENRQDDKRWFEIASLATQEYPNHAEGFNDSGGYYADLQDWKKAREMFEKARQLDPKSAGPLMNLGSVCLEAKDYPAARKYFEEAIKLDPNGRFAGEAKQALAKLKRK